MENLVELKEEELIEVNGGILTGIYKGALALYEAASDFWDGFTQSAKECECY